MSAKISANSGVFIVVSLFLEHPSKRTVFVACWSRNRANLRIVFSARFGNAHSGRFKKTEREQPNPYLQTPQLACT
jgi:hypothetical protein